MSQVRNEGIHISNKYKIQMEPIHKKDFTEILNEVLSHNNNQKNYQIKMKIEAHQMRIGNNTIQK